VAQLRRLPAVPACRRLLPCPWQSLAEARRLALPLLQALLEKQRRQADSDSKMKAGRLVMLEAQLQGAQQREEAAQQQAAQLRAQLEAAAAELARLGGESGAAAELRGELRALQQALRQEQAHGEAVAGMREEEVFALEEELQVRGVLAGGPGGPGGLGSWAGACCWSCAHWKQLLVAAWLGGMRPLQPTHRARAPPQAASASNEALRQQLEDAHARCSEALLEREGLQQQVRGGWRLPGLQHRSAGHAARAAAAELSARLRRDAAAAVTAWPPLAARPRAPQVATLRSTMAALERSKALLQETVMAQVGQARAASRGPSRDASPARRPAAKKAPAAGSPAAKVGRSYQGRLDARRCPPAAALNTHPIASY
jgi:hypothetical protein